MEYTKDRVETVTAQGSAGATKLLASARGGDVEALADFVAWSIYNKLIRDGLNHIEAVEGTWTLIQIVDINLKVVG